LALPVLAETEFVAIAPTALAVAFPLFPPLAASMLPATPEVVLLPTWPLALAAPEVLPMEPVSAIEFVSPATTFTELFPTADPPVVADGNEPVERPAVAAPMPSPAASPVVATPVATLADPTCWKLLELASPVEALAVAVVSPAVATVIGITKPEPADAPVPVAFAVPWLADPEEDAFAPVAVALALPELAPLAASTVPTLPDVIFEPL